MNIITTSRQPFRTHWERLLGETESPIESAFLAAFCELAVEHGYDVAPRAAGNSIIGIEPQKVIDRYRADFAVSFVFHAAGLHLVVELDGHAFHEKTKCQAKRDKRRDRDLASLGYHVIRFTGSEVYEAPKRCAHEVLDRIMAHQTATIVKAMEVA